jgi:hypothetical protein
VKHLLLLGIYGLSNILETARPVLASPILILSVGDRFGVTSFCSYIYMVKLLGFMCHFTQIRTPSIRNLVFRCYVNIMFSITTKHIAQSSMATFSQESYLVWLTL